MTQQEALESPGNAVAGRAGLDSPFTMVPEVLSKLLNISTDVNFVSSPEVAKENTSSLLLLKP